MRLIQKAGDSLEGMAFLLMDIMPYNPYKLVGVETASEIPHYLKERGGTIGKELSSLLDGIFMAVPKTKISYSKKRIKNYRLYKKQINWSRCDRCGEPKLTHGICEEYKDICALGEEDFQKYLSKQLQQLNADNK
mgnify:CR=1 FL=1